MLSDKVCHVISLEPASVTYHAEITHFPDATTSDAHQLLTRPAPVHASVETINDLSLSSLKPK